MTFPLEDEVSPPLEQDLLEKVGSQGRLLLKEKVCLPRTQRLLEVKHSQGDILLGKNVPFPGVMSP
jgi:hypothetical protein